MFPGLSTAPFTAPIGAVVETINHAVQTLPRLLRSRSPPYDRKVIRGRPGTSTLWVSNEAAVAGLRDLPSSTPRTDMSAGGHRSAAQVREPHETWLAADAAALGHRIACRCRSAPGTTVRLLARTGRQHRKVGSRVVTGTHSSKEKIAGLGLVGSRLVEDMRPRRRPVHPVGVGGPIQRGTSVLWVCYSVVARNLTAGGFVPSTARGNLRGRTGVPFGAGDFHQRRDVTNQW